MNPVFASIPMPKDEIFGDVMDYVDKLQQRKALEKYRQQQIAQQQAENEALQKYRQQTLSQQQAQYNVTNKLDLQKLAELTNYHQNTVNNANKFSDLKSDLLKAKILSEQNLAKQRETASSTLGNLSKANITKNQAIIQSIDNVTPLINELKSKDFPNQLYGKYIHPNAQANYESHTSEAADSLLAALGLPKTNESLHLINTMIVRKGLESEESYHKRLDKLLLDLRGRKERAFKSLKSGISGLTEGASSSSESSEDLSEIDPYGVLG